MEGRPDSTERKRAGASARWRRVRASLLVACVLFSTGCTTPTLPLPPPTEPSVTASATAGKVHLHGAQGATPNALVIAYNLNPNVPRTDRVTGTQADQFGTWDMDVIATSKDVLELTQETGGTRSASVEVSVP